MIVIVAIVLGVGPYDGSGRPFNGRPRLPSRLPLTSRGSCARRERMQPSFARPPPGCTIARALPPFCSSRPHGDKSPAVRVCTPWVVDRRRRRRTGPCNHICSWRWRKAPAAAGTRSTQDRASVSVSSSLPTSSLALAFSWLFLSKRPRSSLGDCSLVTACLPRTYTVVLCPSSPGCARACARSFPCSSRPCFLDPPWSCDGQRTLRRSVDSAPIPHLVSPIPTPPPPLSLDLTLECHLSKRPQLPLGDNLLVLVCSPRTHAAVLCTRSPGCNIARALPPFCLSRPRGDRTSPVRVWTPWVADRWRRPRTRPSNHTCSWLRRKAPAVGTR